LHDGASHRVAFLLGIFLWRSKEKYLDLQVETRIQEENNPDNSLVGKTSCHCKKKLPVW